MPYALPTLGTLGSNNQTDAVSYIDRLVLESVTRRLPLEPAADRNLNLYLGYHWETAAPNDFVDRITVNRILNAIIAQVAVQTEQQPRVKFTPRESLEPPIYYINTKLDTSPTPEVLALLQSIPPETQASDAATGQMPRPLTDQEVQMVEAAIDNASRMAQATGQQTTIPADILIGVTDRTASESVQTIFDAKWDECDGDFKVGENLLFNGVVGWQWMMFEWDDDRSLPILRNVPWLQVHIDPLATDVRDAQYVIYDQAISADEASALFPELEAEIRLQAMPGTLRPAGTQYRQTSVYNTVFQRDMITLRTAWLRNQPVLLTPEEAMARGLITSELKTDTTPVVCSCGVGETMPMSQHTEGCDCREGYTPPDVLAGLVSYDGNAPGQTEPTTDDAGLQSDVDAATPTETEGTNEDVATKEEAESTDSQPAGTDQPGDEAGETDAEEGSESQSEEADEVLSGPEAALPPSHKVVQTTIYRLAKSKGGVQTGDPDEPGDEVKPGERSWPSRPILRQIRTIVNAAVDDRECEFVDIPMCLNINIPIPYSPYGQGEPERLQGLQMAINSVISDMVTHWHMHAQPAEFIPESVNQALPSFAQKQYTATPGTKFIVPDNIMQQLQGKMGWYMDPPKIPADAVGLLQLLLKLIDDESEQSEVLQGKASASWSGEAINALQHAARGSIGWKSRRTEFMLKHLVRLIEGCIVHRMPIAEKMRYVRKYPEQVWDAMQSRIINLEHGISVEIASGSGAKKTNDQQNDRALYELGLLSPQSVLESSNRDPKLELSQKIQWARELSATQAQLPAGSQPVTATQQPTGAPQADQQPQQPQQAPPQQAA